ncbi:MAG: hypothetical protein GY847_01165 [Proteobacteria bacterium]|nr:hypothetical protein [Pseudomonadota bacterium]
MKENIQIATAKINRSAAILGAAIAAIASVIVAFISYQAGRASLSQSTPSDAATTRTAQHFNAMKDFSRDENPAGPWSYGYLSIRQNFGLLPDSRSGSLGDTGLSVWCFGVSIPGLAVSANVALHYIEDDSIVFAPDMLYLSPGANGEASVLRWTARKAAKIEVKGHFDSIKGKDVVSDVQITYNLRRTIFREAVEAHGLRSVKRFTLNVDVDKGDRIDFIVRLGADGRYETAGVGLSVEIDEYLTASQER